MIHVRQLQKSLDVEVNKGHFGLHLLDIRTVHDRANVYGTCRVEHVIFCCRFVANEHSPYEIVKYRLYSTVVPYRYVYAITA